MLFGELLILLALVSGGLLGTPLVLSWAKSVRWERASKRERYIKMQQDLRDALASKDYRKIDDWLLVYADDVTPKVKEQAERRRNELYVESNT